MNKEQVEDAMTDTVGTRAVRYMAEAMDLHETDSDQEQNQIARHMAQFAERERARIRRLIGPALLSLREWHVYGCPPAAECDCCDARRAIDRATRPEAKLKRGAK